MDCSAVVLCGGRRIEVEGIIARAPELCTCQKRGQPTAVIGYDDSLRFATNTLAFLTKLTVDWRLASAVAGGCNISSQSDGSAGATQFGLTSS